MKALAILSGTFDPFHLGHLHLAEQALQAFSHPVRIIPNGSPPHRPPPVASWRDRVEMCRLATAHCRRLHVGTEEAPANGARYTADTLAALRQQNPDATLLLILGSDAYRSFGQWQRPAQILEMAHLLVVPRPEEAPASGATAARPKIAAGAGQVYQWNCAPPAISAAGCRARLASGKDASDLLPPAVAAYIAGKKIYS